MHVGSAVMITWDLREVFKGKDWSIDLQFGARNPFCRPMFLGFQDNCSCRL
jgi:hypothetical protein